MDTAIASLKSLREIISTDAALRKLMNNGESIAAGVTTKPRLNLTSLNTETGMDSYITLSFNKVEAYENESVYYLKVNVITDALNIEDPATLVLSIIGRLNDIITQKDLKFAFGEQFIFGEMEESYFDIAQKTWGYVIIYAVSDEPV